ncbi:MAG: hypothetical protein HXY30_05845 [Pseudorhodoplanes sp.]|nr:hypothetical protein [Pseudorhodoplanes sp.]
MSKIQELRARGIQPRAESSSCLPMIAGGIAAFAAGMLLVMAAGWLPSVSLANLTLKKPAQTAATATPVPQFEGERLGRASTAPLLRQCAPFAELGMDSDIKAQPADIYRLLKLGTRATSLARMVGANPQEFDQAPFVDAWASVADCVYKQNGWALCDPDNRALAVEAATTFVRGMDSAIRDANAAPTGNGLRRAFREKGSPAPLDLRSTKDRVLAGLRSRIENGYLISSDFGMFVPGEIGNVLSSARTVRNACAQRR